MSRTVGTHLFDWVGGYLGISVFPTRQVTIMSHEIPARSKLFPTIPITSSQFVYRRAGETDVKATFARARAAMSAAMDLTSSESGRIEPLATGPVDISTPRTAVANLLAPAR